MQNQIRANDKKVKRNISKCFFQAKLVWPLALKIWFTFDQLAYRLIYLLNNELIKN